MPWNTRSLLVSLLFSFVLLLLIIVGDSYLQYYLFGLCAICALVLTAKLSFKEVSMHVVEFVLWGVFLMGLGVSALHTTTIPLTLQSTATYITGFIVFWVMLVLPKWFDEQLFAKSLVFLALVLSFLALFFALNPNVADLLPGMNMLYATYGHNHLAAVLVLLMPVSWWWVVSRLAGTTKARQMIWLLLPSILTLMIIVSFGRVAIVIAFAQLVVMTMLVKKNSRTTPLLKKVLRVFGFLFLGALIVGIIISIVPTNFLQSLCESRYKEQVCKSIHVEGRGSYWRQSIQIMNRYPLWGAGPGSFTVASKFYSQFRSHRSAYAHNAFLQAMSEMGIVGGVPFILLMGGLLWLALKQVRKSVSFDFVHACVLGIVGIYINVLFDFDWQFSGTWVLSLILLALVLRNNTTSSAVVFKKMRYVIKGLVLSAAIGIVAMAAIYGYAEQYIRSEKTSQAFEFFPYFHWHRIIFETGKLTAQQREKLDQIYWYHPEHFSFQATTASNFSEKKKYLDRLFELDPWQVFAFDTTEESLTNGDIDGARVEVQARYDAWARHGKNEGYRYLSHQEVSTMAAQLTQVAKEEYIRGNFEDAGTLVTQAYAVDEWVLIKTEPWFLQHSPSLNQLSFFERVAKIKPEHFGTYHKIYADAYVQRVVMAVQGNYLTNIDQHLQSLLVLNPEFVKDEQFQAVLDTLLISYAREYNQEGLEKTTQLYSLIERPRWSQKREVENSLLRMAQTQTLHQQWEQVKGLVTAVRSLDTDNYWIAAMPGYVWYFSGDVQGAADRFRLCIDTYKPVDTFSHGECTQALRSITENRPMSINRLQYVFEKALTSQ